MEAGQFAVEPLGENGAAVPTQPLGGGGRVKVSARIEFRDKDGNLERVYENPDDPFVLQAAQFFQAALLGISTGLTFTDITNSTHAQTAEVLAGTVEVAFGIGTTPEAFTDYAIETTAGASSDVIAASVTSIVSGSTSGTFTVTATWTNTTVGTIAISELCLYVTTTAGMGTNATFALTHDVFTGQNVSPSGTAAATLTVTVG